MKGLLVRLILGCAVLLWAWDMIFPWHNTTQEQENRYAQIQQRQTLSVGTVSHPISYFIGSEGASGIEYELSSAFADYLDVQLDTKTYEDTNSLFEALKKGEIDVAAAGLLYEPEQAEAFQIGASYYSASWQVVYQKGKNRPYKIEDLQEPLLIPAGSAIIPFLQRLQATNPDLKWQITSQFTQEELLIQVAEGAIPYTAAISIDVSAAQHIKPNLAVGFDLSDEMPVVWYLPAGAYSELQAALIGFMHNAHETGLISRLEEKYFNHLNKFNYVDSRSFINAIDTVLPKYKHLFEKYRGDLDWQMLAAIAYQESHWDPNATSPTGVRGMMMLTKDTAERMKVANRTNAEQSVRGGAEYLHWIISQLPQSIAAEDRIWYALAGYNMGIGHLWDVRRFTQKLGGDPDNWLDVKKNLPLLAEKRHYSGLKYGYARGYEAFSYVENIRRYLSALQNHLRVKEQQQVADENKPLESSANEAEEKAQAVENSTENAKEQTEKTAEPATQSEVLPANSETNAENTTDKAAEITQPTEPTESTEKTIQENNDEKNEIPTKNEEKTTD